MTHFIHCIAISVQGNHWACTEHILTLYVTYNPAKRLILAAWLTQFRLLLHYHVQQESMSIQDGEFKQQVLDKASAFKQSWERSRK